MMSTRSVRRILILVVLACAVPASSVFAWGQDASPGDVAAGKTLAFDRGKGNCLACHTMKGGDVASTVGPKLSGIKARFPNPADLVAILMDEETRNPQTVMPPFGKNDILTPKDIGDIVAFLYTL